MLCVPPTVLLRLGIAGHRRLECSSQQLAFVPEHSGLFSVLTIGHDVFGIDAPALSLKGG